jgi:hypothetical protein
VSAEAYADIYSQRRIEVDNRPGSHQSHNTRRFTELTFDVLNSIKYDAILEMPWLREKNSRLIESAKNYTMVDVYEIPEQPEMSLSEHKSWDHEILLLNDKQPKWMPLYSMSKTNSRKLTYLDKNLKEDSSDHQSHQQNTQSCLYQRRMTQSNYV